MSTLSIEPIQFIDKFLSIPENSMMYYSNSAEYALILCLMLGEHKKGELIQEMKLKTTEEINIPLIIIESDVYRYISHPTKKLHYDSSNGVRVSFKVDELHKSLRFIRSNLFSIMTELIVAHQLSFPIKLLSEGRKKAKTEIDTLVRS